MGYYRSSSIPCLVTVSTEAHKVVHGDRKKASTCRRPRMCPTTVRAQLQIHGPMQVDQARYMDRKFLDRCLQRLKRSVANAGRDSESLVVCPASANKSGGQEEDGAVTLGLVTESVDDEVLDEQTTDRHTRMPENLRMRRITISEPLLLIRFSMSSDRLAVGVQRARASQTQEGMIFSCSRQF
ncbi:MAG: hypothetical protein L6R40_004383 [Gallowayella cf. fulva]|nr:MAG: hypothetical protein L6R40_004383 [Xanthomendoza cf. fulva]